MLLLAKRGRRLMRLRMRVHIAGRCRERIRRRRGMCLVSEEPEREIGNGKAAEDEGEREDLHIKILAYTFVIFAAQKRPSQLPFCSHIKKTDTTQKTYHRFITDRLDEPVENLRKRMRTDRRPGHLARIPLHALFPVVAHHLHRRHAALAITPVVDKVARARTHLRQHGGGGFRRFDVDV